MTGLAFIFRPSWWLRNYPTSNALSEFIAERLDYGEIPEIKNECVMTLGGVTLWCGNFPYAYGSTFGDIADEFLPTRKVAYRLRQAEKKVIGDTEKQIRDRLYAAAVARVGGTP